MHCTHKCPLLYIIKEIIRATLVLQGFHAVHPLFFLPPCIKFSYLSPTGIIPSFSYWAASHTGRPRDHQGGSQYCIVILYNVLLSYGYFFLFLIFFLLFEETRLSPMSPHASLAPKVQNSNPIPKQLGRGVKHK